MKNKESFNTTIKGNTWTICQIDKACDMLGFTDPSSKTITIYSHIEYAENCKDINYLITRTIRHELIHAFLFESGLSECLNSEENGHDEQMIDWFANIYQDYRETLSDVMEKLQNKKETENER